MSGASLPSFEPVREAVRACLPDVRAIYVHGSQARGGPRPDSDIDVAVLLPPARSIVDPLGLRAALSTRLGREVDVVDLASASDVLRAEVLRHGIRIHADDADAILGWEAEALTRHARYREETADIREQFRRTGIGYAPT